MAWEPNNSPGGAVFTAIQEQGEAMAALAANGTMPAEYIPEPPWVHDPLGLATYR